MVNIINELKKIGKSEINFCISYFYDSTWIFQLGDELNGYTYEESFSSIEVGANNLIREIIKQFPDSNYIKQLKSRCYSVVVYGLDLFEVK